MKETAIAPLKIAVVGGSGLIGKRHCQHVTANSSTELIAIVDPSPAAIEVAKIHATALYSSLPALLESPHKPDAAIVCTPNHTHVPLSVQLLQAGVHVLCEKPISTDVESAKTLIREAEKHNVKLLIGHHRRFNPYMLAAKKIVDSEVLGAITAVNGLWAAAKPAEYFCGDFQWRSNKRQGGGPILINFIHEVDLMHYLFGPVTRIHAEKTISRRNPENENSAEEGAAIILRFASGVVGTFLISDNVASPHSFEQGTGENPLLPRTGLDVYRVFGTKGTLSVPDMLLSTYGQKEPSWQQEMLLRRVEIENAAVAPFDSQLEHFVSVCRGEASPSCTGEEGLRALQVCKAVRSALERPGSGGSVDIDPLELESHQLNGL